mmetsp:Transcript_40638/g.111830  ORF Transcript_40638/g.111830 Transcript_40638/m.111830 type:complete len:203 (+) Transcript_40638:693-1301(+)
MWMGGIAVDEGVGASAGLGLQLPSLPGRIENDVLPNVRCVHVFVGWAATDQRPLLFLEDHILKRADAWHPQAQPARRLHHFLVQLAPPALHARGRSARTKARQELTIAAGGVRVEADADAVWVGNALFYAFVAVHCRPSRARRGGGRGAARQGPKGAAQPHGGPDARGGLHHAAHLAEGEALPPAITHDIVVVVAARVEPRA